MLSQITDALIEVRYTCPPIVTTQPCKAGE